MSGRIIPTILGKRWEFPGTGSPPTPWSFDSALELSWFRSYLNGLVVFPTFFNLSLNLAIRSSWSEPQSAPSLAFADCIELLHLWCKEYNQSNFIVDHLVISMRRVFSCVVGRGCLLWPVSSLGKTLLDFALFHSVLQGSNLPVTPGKSTLLDFL